MILLLDNYDSFVHNLARYLRELGEEVVVRRNDRIDIDEAAGLEPSHLVISPGPCTPAESGVATELVRELAPEVPTLGVCLGHQCIAAAYGAEIVWAERPMHGKNSFILHDGSGLFAGLPRPLRATRYHSLVVREDSLPEEIEVIARAGAADSDGGPVPADRSGGSSPDDLGGSTPEDADGGGTGSEGAGEVMAIRHREHPAWGVQFHPEAVLSQGGHDLLANFLALGRGHSPEGAAREGLPAELPPETVERAGAAPPEG